MIEVSDLMTTGLKTLDEEHNLAEARDLMGREHIRHIPILDANNQFVGLLTQRDVLANTVSNLADFNDQERQDIEAGVKVSEIMITDINTVEEHTSLREAAEYLLDHKYGCLPVVDEEGYLVGIVTESDFMKLVIHLLENMED